MRRLKRKSGLSGVQAQQRTNELHTRLADRDAVLVRQGEETVRNSPRGARTEAHTHRRTSPAPPHQVVHCRRGYPCACVCRDAPVVLWPLSPQRQSRAGCSHRLQSELRAAACEVTELRRQNAAASEMLTRVRAQLQRELASERVRARPQPLGPIRVPSNTRVARTY